MYSHPLSLQVTLLHLREILKKDKKVKMAETMALRDLLQSDKLSRALATLLTKHFAFSPLRDMREARETKPSTTFTIKTDRRRTNPTGCPSKAQLQNIGPKVHPPVAACY